MFVLRFVARCIGWLLLVLGMAASSAWIMAALFLDGPFGRLNVLLAAVICLGLLAILFFVRPLSLNAVSFFTLCALVLGWWFTIPASNDRNWQADMAETPWAESDGEVVTLHNLRNCDYRTETDYTPRWETRQVQLSQLTGLDVFVTYWGSPHIAHPIVSFRFQNGPPVCFSIETRKEVGEKYSPLAGFFRQYELIYVMADERDVIRLRTNFRETEDVFLYHSKTPPEVARALFLDYVRTANQLNKDPQWYNALTANCTTGVRLLTEAVEGARPWDWRLFVNGHMDAQAYELGMLDTTLPFPELKRLSRVNERGKAVGQAADFSAKIREGLPGFAAPKP